MQPKIDFHVFETPKLLPTCYTMHIMKVILLIFKQSSEKVPTILAVFIFGSHILKVASRLHLQICVTLFTVHVIVNTILFNYKIDGNYVNMITIVRCIKIVITKNEDC